MKISWKPPLSSPYVIMSSTIFKVLVKMQLLFAEFLLLLIVQCTLGIIVTVSHRSEQSDMLNASITFTNPFITEKNELPIHSPIDIDIDIIAKDSHKTYAYILKSKI